VEETEQPLRGDYVYAVKDEAAYLQADDEKPPIPREPFPSTVYQLPSHGEAVSAEQVAKPRDG
jgi:hypothetical protein